MSGVQLTDGAADCPFGGLAGANHQAGRMRRSRDEKSIADRVDRRRIDDDPIEFSKQIFDHIFELLVAEKLGWIGRRDDQPTGE